MEHIIRKKNRRILANIYYMFNLMQMSYNACELMYYIYPTNNGLTLINARICGGHVAPYVLSICLLDSVISSAPSCLSLDLKLTNACFI